MDRNSILGILLIASILIIWGIVQSPDKKELEARKRTADSLALVRQVQKAADSLSIMEQPDTVAAVPPAANDSLEAVQLQNSLGEFAALAHGENKFYVIENDLIKLTVSAKGGRPYSVELKQYRTFGKQPIVLFDGDSTQFGLNF
jgi:YidC/Oxa1 family membrane protein insertase